jgi:hypothetical protein
MPHRIRVVGDDGKPLKAYHPVLLALCRGDAMLCRGVEVMGERIAQAEGDAYVPAGELLDDEYCPTYQRLRRLLKRNPWVRVKHPRPNRLLVHRWDWERLRRQHREQNLPDRVTLEEALQVVAAHREREAAREAAREESLRKKRAGG